MRNVYFYAFALSFKHLTQPSILIKTHLCVRITVPLLLLSERVRKVPLPLLVRGADYMEWTEWNCRDTLEIYSTQIQS